MSERCPAARDLGKEEKEEEEGGRRRRREEEEKRGKRSELRMTEAVGGGWFVASNLVLHLRPPLHSKREQQRHPS